MASFIIYIIRWGLVLTLLYSFFGLMMKRETLHHVNRVVLLTILITSMVLPLCQIETNETNIVAKGREMIECQIQNVHSPLLTNMPLSTNSPDVEASLQPLPVSRDSHQVQEAKASQNANIYIVGLIAIYIIGVVVSCLYFLWQVFSLLLLIHRGKRIEVEGLPNYVHVLTHPAVDTPCSWMRWMILSPSDAMQVKKGEKSAQLIVSHEQAHICLGHSWDMLFCELVCRMLWCVPFVWMLRQDLRDVHEYQADRRVLSLGVKDEEYQLLLIRKATGTGLQPVVNALNQSPIKRRFKMMYQKPSRRWASLKAAYLLPLSVMALAAFAQVKNVAQPLSGSNDNDYVYTFVRDESLEYDAKKPMPSNADKRYEMVMYWLEQNMQYTDDMRARGIGGNITVQPYVNSDGSYGNVKWPDNLDPALKAEVQRLMKAMPKPLMKGLLPLTTKQGYTYLVVPIFDRTQRHQPFNKRERMIVWHEDKNSKVPPRLRQYYLVNIPLGATYVDMEGSSRIITRRGIVFQRAASDYFALMLQENVKLSLNGKPFDRNSLPDLPADDLKKVVFKKSSSSPEQHLVDFQTK